MDPLGPRTPYEVVCPDCRVSFPVGTRSCLHCGRSLGRQRFQRNFELPPGSEDRAVDEETVRRPGGLSPVTLIWVVLLLAGYLYRSCSG